MKKNTNLPARDIVVDLGNGMSMTDIREIRGSVFHLLVGKVIAPAACDHVLDVTYRIGTTDSDDVIVHKGYMINTRQQVEDIQTAVLQFFTPYTVV